MGTQASQGIPRWRRARHRTSSRSATARRSNSTTSSRNPRRASTLRQGPVQRIREQLTKLQAGLDGAVTNVGQSFDKAGSGQGNRGHPREREEGRDAVKPWWQKALAFVVSIIVAVVVVIAVTALIAVTGPVGMILVGALAGALSTVLSTMASKPDPRQQPVRRHHAREASRLGALGARIGGGLTGANHEGRARTTIARR